MRSKTIDSTAEASALDQVYAYHQRSKHRFEAYAPGPGTLDWDEQPDPFRRFADSALLALPPGLALDEPYYGDLFVPAAVNPQPLNLDTLGTLLRLGLGISAWKQDGTDRWAVRSNPSSGNLHPTEAYVVLAALTQVQAGVYHYQAEDHALAARCLFDEAWTGSLRAQVPADHFLLGLSTVHWREAWKYGERAYRYCQLDLGHAEAGLAYAAAALGWTVHLLSHWPDAAVSRLLGLDRTADFVADEEEYPGPLLLVGPAAIQHGPGLDSAAMPLERLGELPWQGRANTLDPRHFYDWPVIGQTAQACEKPLDGPAGWSPPELPPRRLPGMALPVRDVIFQRRSARTYDPRTALPARAFYALLDGLLPRAGSPLRGLADQRPQVHLVFFVHRVDGLAKGVYALPLTPEAEPTLRTSLRPAFRWEKPADCPDPLPLYHLVGGDGRRLAGRLGCQQAIAADGAFTVALLGEFDAALEAGPWAYRALLREAGQVGQALYLEAEAAGMRGTGIGCFFDDAVHEVLGITGTNLQCLYLFAVGAPLPEPQVEPVPWLAP